MNRDAHIVTALFLTTPRNVSCAALQLFAEELVAETPEESAAEDNHIPDEPEDLQKPVPDIFESVMYERKSRSLFWLTLVIASVDLCAFGFAATKSRR